MGINVISQQWHSRNYTYKIFARFAGRVAFPFISSLSSSAASSSSSSSLCSLLASINREQQHQQWCRRLRDQTLSIIIDDCDSSIADGDHPLRISLLYSTARLLFEMGNGPAPFSEIGKRTRDLLTKDYNYDQKFTLSMLGSSGMGLTATGVKKDHLFVGDIITLYKSGNTTVDVKVDTSSNVSTTVSIVEVLPSTKVALSFKIPDQKSGKLDVQYIHPHSAINSSIGLTPTPLLELAATIGSRELMLGGEVGFDAGTASFTKCNFGIGLFKPDFSAAVVLADKGETVKASYIHSVNSATGVTVAAEMTHRLSTYENSFTLGSSHPIDPFTVVKTRFSDNGKVAMLCQREWRPKSLVTFSGEYDAKAINSTPKFGLALALKP